MTLKAKLLLYYVFCLSYYLSDLCLGLIIATAVQMILYGATIPGLVEQKPEKKPALKHFLHLAAPLPLKLSRLQKAVGHAIMWTNPVEIKGEQKWNCR